ncbi:DUF2871 domain-containing protein [Pygmaiobacter massiliensis]|uniref:DUF2871 domain-containing protein n=1 Tax=Pygmaiobacter massiliensis TaxID=1917873 RepID=UPI002A835E2C|nr:DUF2871 domain-containing protein [Pygmaiobacter massiliensis]MDY4784130.1 DUF2871 domain-containing protein [Pygmaiobacter massiliensis]
MKKLINLSLTYAIAGMAGGVFYREFTKWNGFTGVTALGKVHVHLLILGTVIFLIAALFAKVTPLQEQRLYRPFLITYNIGVPLTAIMLVVRGILEVRAVPLSAALNASISGISGIAHIITGTGLVLLLLALRKAADAATK